MKLLQTWHTKEEGRPVKGGDDRAPRTETSRAPFALPFVLFLCWWSGFLPGPGLIAMARQGSAPTSSKNPSPSFSEDSSKEVQDTQTPARRKWNDAKPRQEQASKHPVPSKRGHSVGSKPDQLGQAKPPVKPVSNPQNRVGQMPNLFKGGKTSSETAPNGGVVSQSSQRTAALPINPTPHRSSSPIAIGKATPPLGPQNAAVLNGTGLKHKP
jgi:hypothetical protein